MTTELLILCASVTVSVINVSTVLIYRSRVNQVIQERDAWRRDCLELRAQLGDVRR